MRQRWSNGDDGDDDEDTRRDRDRCGSARSVWGGATNENLEMMEIATAIAIAFAFAVGSRKS